jgi:MoxR-like ATPase
MVKPERLLEIENGLKNVGYIPNEKICNAIFVAEATNKPLLIEGFPGVGKTALAKAYAQANDYNFIRVQLYDGLTDDKILYDYNYQKQLLTLEAIKPQIEREFGSLSANEAISSINKQLDFYGPDFLIERPILKAISSDKRTVLLLDEIDKAPEEIEYMLYEFLENFSISIPQYGEIKAEPGKEPIVFITSNNYRDISEPFRRRCVFLYIDKKSKKEIVDILIARAHINEEFADKLAKCFMTINAEAIRKYPSVSELIDLAKLIETGAIDKTSFVTSALSILVKDKKDEEKINSIVQKCGDSLWN